MPAYRVQLVVKSLGKRELVGAIKRNVEKLMEGGGLVTGLESGGHRDLPVRFHSKTSGELDYTANLFTVEAQLGYKTRRALQAELLRDGDLLAVQFHKVERGPELAAGGGAGVSGPEDCRLAEQLLPAAERASVAELRSRQSLHPFSRREAWRRARDSYRRIPKSFTVAPHKK